MTDLAAKRARLGAKCLGLVVLCTCATLAALLMFLPPPSHVPTVIAGLVLMSAAAGVLLAYGLRRWIGAVVGITLATAFGAGSLAARNATAEGVAVPLTVSAREAQCALDIRGDLTDDLYRRVQRELDAHPGIRAVTLESAGGSALAIAKVAGLLQQRGVRIAAMHDQCDSACAFLWVAAQERYVIGTGAMPVAGFHAPHVAIPWTGTHRAVLQDRQQRAYLRSAGLPEDFIGWAYASVDGFWRPDTAQLERLGVKTRHLRVQHMEDVDFCKAVPGSRKA